MTHAALRIIREEHRALSAVLSSMGMLLTEHWERGTPVDFGVLRAMLLYVDEFPEKLHHSKESKLLFPMLRARSDEIAAVLDRLDSDHEFGEKAIRGLEHDLLAYEVLGASRREALKQAAAKYINFYLEHMAVEENEVLPVALRVLSGEQWRELDQAFLANRDPLTGYDPTDEYRPLFSRIVTNTPAPIGIG